MTCSRRITLEIGCFLAYNMALLLFFHSELVLSYYDDKYISVLPLAILLCTSCFTILGIQGSNFKRELDSLHGLAAVLASLVSTSPKLPLGYPTRYSFWFPYPLYIVHYIIYIVIKCSKCTKAELYAL